ncbi:hypothetical protein F4780DRAFT_287167 [Xylariomycetidae sp. FL0641]|nr:hypothetical protein F4780DRAFT_287167 [Xylariomycetidae sp. FL0641]
MLGHGVFNRGVTRLVFPVEGGVREGGRHLVFVADWAEVRPGDVLHGVGGAGFLLGGDSSGCPSLLDVGWALFFLRDGDGLGVSAGFGHLRGMGVDGLGGFGGADGLRVPRSFLLFLLLIGLLLLNGLIQRSPSIWNAVARPLACVAVESVGAARYPSLGLTCSISRSVTWISISPIITGVSL